LDDTISVSDRIHGAVRNPYNIFALSVGVALSAALNHLAPLLLTVVGETVYLVVVVATGRQRPSAKDDSQAVANMPAPAPDTVKKESARGGTFRVKGAREPSPSDLTPEAQERYLRIEATYRLIRLQVDDSKPEYREMTAHLEYLMSRFVYFAVKLEKQRDRLRAIDTEIKTLKGSQKLAAGVVDLQLVYSAGDRAGEESLEEWIQSRMQQAHEGYERALGEISWQREQGPDTVDLANLDERSQLLLQRNRYVDKLGKTILNLHYELQLLDKKFSMISQEITTRRAEQVLSDVKALVLQTQSLARTIDEVDALESVIQCAAA